MIPSAVRKAWPVLCLAGLLLASLAVQLQGLLNHDTAWYLYATDQFLGGARLYREIFEVNPPLAFYLTVPPLWLARTFSFSSLDAFILYVFVLLAGSLALLRSILAGLQALSPGQRRTLLVAALLAAGPLSGSVFGQREHLTLILSLPYLFLLAVRCEGGRPRLAVRILAGLLAGLGLALKPHFLLLPAALEVYRLARGGGWTGIVRAETVALGGIVAVYAASIPLLTPDYLETVVPFARAIYDAYEAAPSVVLLAGLPLLSLPLLWLQTRRSRGFGAIADLLLIATGAFFLAYALQLKGWWYQLYPAAALLLLALGACLAALWPERARRGRLALSGAVVLLAVLPWSQAGISAQGYASPVYELLAPVVRAEPPGSPIFVFSTSGGFPLVNYTGARWSSRFPGLWLLPGAVRHRLQETAEGRLLERIERFTRDAVVEDLTRTPPVLVFVDERPRKPRFGELAFDYLAYFSADPRFAAFWRNYERTADLGPFAVYRRRGA